MIKKIFPILAIILVLTCVSSVSAEDNQTHSITSENTIQHESNHVDKTITKTAFYPFSECFIVSAIILDITLNIVTVSS